MPSAFAAGAVARRPCAVAAAADAGRREAFAAAAVAHASIAATVAYAPIARRSGAVAAAADAGRREAFAAAAVAHRRRSLRPLRTGRWERSNLVSVQHVPHLARVHGAGREHWPGRLGLRLHVA